MSGGYCVCVTFRVAGGHAGAFAARAARQAADSRAEPGCRAFDAWTDAARPNEVFLYEVYDDRAAFDAHLDSAHFRAFDAETRDMVEDKTVTTHDRALSLG